LSKKSIYLIDGSALAYRSHFAFIRRPLINSKGMNTSAAFGFFTMLLKIQNEKKPDLLIVTFDAPGKNFRHAQYAEYKATREKMPHEMRDQIPYIHRAVRGFGLPLLSIPGYEADDVIGTLARQGCEAGHEVFIVTADKDLMQLVNENVKVFNPWSRPGQPNFFGPKEVEKKLGVTPERVVDLLALMGDKSDNVPGVPSIGEKTAMKLLGEFDNLDNLLEKVDEVKAKRARENLKTHRELALLSRKLVTLDLHVPLEKALHEFTNDELDRELLSEIFSELEFLALHKRFSKDVETEPHEYTIIDSEEELDRVIKEFQKAPSFVFDLETTSLNKFEAKVVGVALCCKAGRAYYIPTNVKREVKVGETPSLFAALEQDDTWLERLAPLLEDESLAKGGQNIKYDAIVLANHGIKVRGITFDTILEAYILDPGAPSRKLDDLALHHLSYRKIATKELIGSGRRQKSMADLPVETVAKYAAEDADITFRLHEHFTEQLAESPDLVKLYKEVELPLMDVLMRLEQTGVKVDTEVLSKLSIEFDKKASELLAKAHELAGEEFNLKSPKQLRAILYDKLEVHKIAKVRPKKTGGGELSTDVSVLERMAPSHPLPRIILDYRSFTKLQGTYVDALPRLVNPKTKRVHTSFNQAVAATGRLSSSDPNLQNIPIRTAEGMKIRGAFVAGHEGWLLVSCDYSQVELRLLAHFSGEETLIEAFNNGADIHRATAARIFNCKAEDVSSALRSRAKAINFGIIYGMGAMTLARQTGLTRDEAQQFIDSYFETYPKVRAYLDGQIEAAEKHGYVETILGRRREILEINNNNQQLRANAERIATNTPIQGSAADLIKVAMIHIDRRLTEENHPAVMLLQVHDELIFECPKDQCEALKSLVKEEMESVFDLKVPLLVDIGEGKSWLEAH
jgi:DNA polymerase I